jgi:hypothetical protein
VIMLITGVRQRLPQLGRFAANWIHTGISPRLEKGRPSSRLGPKRGGGAGLRPRVC